MGRRVDGQSQYQLNTVYVGLTHDSYDQSSSLQKVLSVYINHLKVVVHLCESWVHSLDLGIDSPGNILSNLASSISTVRLAMRLYKTPSSWRLVVPATCGWEIHATHDKKTQESGASHIP